jgi:hypothetical protein
MLRPFRYIDYFFHLKKPTAAFLQTNAIETAVKNRNVCIKNSIDHSSSQQRLAQGVLVCTYIEIPQVPYVPPILGQLLDLISPAKINISEPRFKSYDP